MFIKRRYSFDSCTLASAPRKDAAILRTISYERSGGMWSSSYFVPRVRNLVYEHMQFPSLAISLMSWRNNHSLNTVCS
jgi:hypothetical protein